MNNISNKSNTAPFFMAGWRHLAAWLFIIIIIKYFILDDYLMQLGLIDRATTLDPVIAGTLLTALITLAGIRQFDKLRQTDTKGFSDFIDLEPPKDDSRSNKVNSFDMPLDQNGV